MPYFPIHDEPKPYKCQGCDQWFVMLAISSSCCVMHHPGSCCHHGERAATSEEIAAEKGDQ